MARVRAYRADLLLVAGFLILPLLLFAQVTLGSQTMVPADNLVQWQPWAGAAAELGVESPHNTLISDLLVENYAWKRFINQSLATGEIPLWNPYIFAGAPFLATGQNAAYYPFSILFMILPLAKAYGWYTVSQLWLAGVLAYFLGRVLRLPRPAAALAGLVYQGCGFMLVSAAVFPMIIGAAAWLPLLLACIEMVIRHSGGDSGGTGKTLPWMVLGAVALGCQILAGHIEITYYTLLVMVAFAAWRLLRRGPIMEMVKPAGWLLGMVLAGLMLGAIQLVPLYEVLQVNFREGAVSLAEVRGWAFPARRLLTLAVPDFFGNPSHHGYWDVFSGETAQLSSNYYGQANPNGAGTSDWGIKNYVEGGIYLGILPLFLAVLGAFGGWKRRENRTHVAFFLVLSLLSLAFIFGTPLYALLYYGLPGINQLHSPFRWVFPLSLSVALLAGYGLAYLLAERGRAARPLALLALAGGGIVAAGLLISRLAYGAFAPLVERLFLGLAKAPEAFPTAEAFYSYQFSNLLVLALMLLLSGLVLWGIGRGRGVVWSLLVLGVVGLDLFLAGYGFHAVADPALLDYRPALVEWLDNQPQPWRLTTFTPQGDKPLNANVAWLFDFQDVRGYDSIIPRQYTEYMTVIEPQNELLFNRVQPVVDWQALNSPLLDLLGVRYVVTAEIIDLPKYELAWEGDGLRVYENLAAVSRAYTLPLATTRLVDDALVAMAGEDPRNVVFVEQSDWPAGWEVPETTAAVLQPAAIAHYSNLTVLVEATVEEPSWLILNDSHFPGWKAFVRPAGDDGGAEQEVQVVLVNGNFRGVRLDEPGNWTVRFRYSPLTFRVGGLASAMGMVVLAFALMVWGWRRFYDPGTEMTNTRSIAKNSLAPTLLNLLNRFIDFLFAAFYLRLLGPADAGSFATAIAIAGWFEIISNFGLNTLVIREVSREKNTAGQYLLNTTILRLGTTVIGAVPIFIYLGLTSAAGNALSIEAVLAILLLMVGMVFSGVGQSFTGLFYAYETAETPAAIATVTTILKVGFGVVALLLGYGFVGLAAVSIVVNVITLLILAAVTFRTIPLRGPWRVNLAAQWRMLVASYPLMLNHLLANIFFFIDVPMMQQINGEASVGWYNSAYKWINAINVIPSFFTFALFPVISRQIAHSLDDARRTFRMAIKLMVLLSLPIAAFTVLLAHPLIGVLGGAEYLPQGAVALQIVIWSIPVGWINSVTNYVLIALGRERAQVRAFLAGVAFNIVANLLFLPAYGFMAAAVTTILSEVVLLLVFNFYLRERMPNVGWLNLLARPVLVTAVTIVVIVLGAQVHMVLGLALGLVAYPAGLWLLHVFGPEERRILESLLPAPLAARLKLVPPPA